MDAHNHRERLQREAQSRAAKRCTSERLRGARDMRV
jgi:hypothetical protein